jgi:predicted type IV restriction endonuclease
MSWGEAMGITNRVIERIKAGLKKYQPILEAAKARDDNEANTVAIVRGMLADLLGYDMFAEVTSEFPIRGTSVDLAVKVDGDIRFLLEAKSIGTDLKDNHVKQAIDYGANHGIEWVILTNGIMWRLYRIRFQKPIEKDLACEMDLLTTSPKNEKLVSFLGTISKEGFTKSSINEFFQQNRALNKYIIAAVLLSDAMLLETRRQLRRLFDMALVDLDDIRMVIQNDVLKLNVINNEEDARRAQEDVKRATAKAAKAKAEAPSEPPAPAAPPASAGATAVKAAK